MVFVAEQSLYLRELELAIGKVNAEMGDVNARALKATLKQYDGKVLLSKEQLEKQLSEIADQESKVREQNNKARKDIQQLDRQWIAAKQRAEKAKSVSGPESLILDATTLAREINETYAAEIEKMQRIQQRFITELDKQLGTLNLAEKASEVWQSIGAIWGYELTSVDDHPITVRKVATAIVLFLFGILISRRLSRQVGGKVLPKFKVAEGAAAALESLLFYLFVLFFALFALNLAHVPLTVFTVLGGAVAIGIGFGSQNIMNNFISGLILLMEQPIRVGDLIEMDQLAGVVSRIGLRSTVIRTSSSIDIIVPNSSFLEKNVINWTLVDRRVRLKISIGVAYGSPTERVSELLSQSAAEHKQVLAHPRPLVWFKDFGYNALVFEVHFWATVRTLTEKQTIESDIRFTIDRLFKEAEITIAFPQRDIHLDTLRPLEVRMVSG